MDMLIYIVIIVICIILSAFFSGSETALLRISSHEVDEDVKEHVRPTVAAVKELIRNTSRFLITILLGNNVVNILATSSAAVLFVHYFGNERGVIISTVVMTVLILLLSEIIPKAIAARNPKQIAYFFALPLYMLHLLLTPIHWLFEKLIDPILIKVFKSPTQDHIRSYDSILMMAKQIRENTSPHIHGESTALPIIGSTARAAEMTAEDIMIPRAEIFACPKSISTKKLMEQMMDERYTRVPIFDPDLDHVVGLIHLKDLIRVIGKGTQEINSIIKPILRVPERRPILSILAEMQRSFVHVAIVKDEFGTTQGLLTQEDILEEIVGEIRDEFDKDELQSIQKVTDNTYTVLGKTSIHDFNRETGWDIEVDEISETFGGLVFNSLGHAPRLGDKINVGDYEVTVRDLSGNRIAYVDIVRTVKV